MLKLAHKKVSINSKIDKRKDIILKADPNLINQAFNNLAKNAINSIYENNFLIMQQKLHHPHRNLQIFQFFRFF